MNIDINKLIESYFEGETTLAQEQQLKTYFKSDSIAPEHESYRSLFVGFSGLRQEKAPTQTAPFEEKKNKIFTMKVARWSTIAAVILLTVGTVFNLKPWENHAFMGTNIHSLNSGQHNLLSLVVNEDQSPVSSEMEQSYKQSLQILNLVSSKMNSGVDPIQKAVRSSTAQENKAMSRIEAPLQKFDESLTMPSKKLDKLGTIIQQNN